MTVSLTGTGGYFTRLGKQGGLLRNAAGWLGSTAPSPSSAWGSGGATISALDTNISGIFGQYASNEQSVISNLYGLETSLRSAVFSPVWSELSTEALTTLIAQVDRDVTLPGVSKDRAGAMAELIRQVANSSDSVKKPTITITPAAGTPAATGTLVLAGCVIGPNGVQLDYIFNETVDVVCVADSYTGGATAGQESLLATGDSRVDYSAYNWPAGSGCNVSLNAVDANVDAGTNFLTNSDFSDFTVANTPDNWTIVTGAAGTNIFSEASDVYGGSGKALKLTGDGGGTLTKLYQALTTLVASGVYALNAFVHVDAAAPAAGTLIFELVDSSGTIINDDAGTANRYTVDLTQTTLQTTYKATGAMTTTELAGNALSGGGGAIFFRMPKTWTPGASARVQMRFGTAITSAKNVFIDHMALCAATQLYGAGLGGGPYAAIFSGATKLVNADRFKLTVSNGYQSQFQNLLWRFFDMPGMRQQMPSAASNTINENLI